MPDNIPPDFNANVDDWHHRRIRHFHHGGLVLCGAFLILIAGWAFFRMLTCASATGALASTCADLYITPLIAAAFTVAAFGAILYLLGSYGASLRRQYSSDPPLRGLSRIRHISHGYRHIHRSHRSHVKRSFISIFIVLSAYLAILAKYLDIAGQQDWLVMVGSSLVIALSVWIAVTRM